MLRVNQLVGFGVGAVGSSGPPPAPAPITYIGHFAGTTWTAAPIDTTDASDVVVVGFMSEGPFGSNTTGFTVDGDAATLWSPGKLTLANITGGHIEFYYIQPGVLATADIVATISGSGADMFVYVLRGVSATPLDVVPSTQATSTSIALDNIETEDLGAVIALGVIEPNSATFTEAWTGSETVIEDDELNSPSGNHRTVACSFETTGASTTSDLTLTISNSKAHIGGAISFGP
jgi:hypothetical protein